MPMTRCHHFTTANAQWLPMHKCIRHHSVCTLEYPPEGCARDIHPCCPLFLRQALDVSQPERLKLVRLEIHGKLDRRRTGPRQEVGNRRE
jgi:hypothetical protein